MSNNKKSGGLGYGITLTLCAAAIAVAGIFYYRNTGEETPSLPEPVSDVVVLPDQDQVREQDVAAVATQATVGTEAESTAPTEKKILKTGAPVAGETVMGYAMETLAYNETTRDWRTHNGIDIAAEAGTPVLAAAEGVVYTVYEDDTMGTTVVVRHSDGYTTQYSSLAAELSVSVGDQVELGQAIGCVGETALLETAVGPHVHFTVTCNDEPVDPVEFLALS